MSKRINSIDVLRLVAAFFIVMIHNPYTMPYVRPICRFAVPVFFMISGYFYCVPKEKKKSRIKKVFFLTVIANAAYFLIQLAAAIPGEGIVSYLKETFTLKNTVSFLLFNESPFGTHLWYLLALLYCMIIDYFLSEFLFKRKKLCIAVIVVLLLGDLVFGKYSLLLFNREFNYIYVRNFLFFGLPNFWIGKLFRDVDTAKIKLNNIVLILFIVLFAATTLAEKYTLSYFDLNAEREQYISTTLLALSIFILALKNPMENPGKISGFIAGSGKKYSLAIYIIHPLALKVGSMAFGILKITPSGIVLSTVLGILAFAGSWIIAIIYYSVKEKIYSPYKNRH